MTMPSTAPTARPVKPSLAFAEDDDEDAFSKLASSSRPKPASRLPPVEPNSLVRPPTASKPAASTQDTIAEDDDGEDDYMSMTVADPTATETALQRLKRRKLEASIRGHPLSKAELAEQERQKRDAGLSTSILNNSASKGLKMMKAMGYSTGAALGKSMPEDANPGTDSRTIEPIKPVVRESRTGIGHTSELKRKFSDSTTARDDTAAAAKRQELSPESYRNRLTQEAQQRRHEAQLFAAQSICEKLVAEDPPTGYEAGSKPVSSTDDQTEKNDSAQNPNTAPDANPHYKSDFFSGNPTFTQIKQINLIYRGLLYRRALSDLKARLRKEQNESLSVSKSAHIPKPVLPKYNAKGEFSEDDKLALSLGGDINLEESELDEEWEDSELEEFEKREVKDRLDEIVRYLRSQWRYCFWCKFRYGSDEELERDCPGPAEEDHD